MTHSFPTRRSSELVECSPVAGSGETGSIRIINGAVVEPLIGATSLSYTYAQTEGPMAALGYHGTLACEPADEGSSMIVYTLAYDQSALDPDERAASRARIESRFGGAVEAMRQFCLPNLIFRNEIGRTSERRREMSERSEEHTSELQSQMH